MVLECTFCQKASFLSAWWDSLCRAKYLMNTKKYLGSCFPTTQVSRVKLECTVTVHIKVNAAWSLVRTREELKTRPLQWLRKLLGMGGVVDITAGTLLHNDRDLTGGFCTNSDFLPTRESFFSEWPHRGSWDFSEEGLQGWWGIIATLLCCSCVIYGEDWFKRFSSWKVARNRLCDGFSILVEVNSLVLPWVNSTVLFLQV